MQTSRIEYAALDMDMVGYLASPDGTGGDRHPGVLLMHEGGGQDDNVRNRAERLAERGYVTFALDYLGGGGTHSRETVQSRLGALRGNHEAIRSVALAGYEILSRQDEVNPERIGATGFCFGGVIALELARSGVPLRAAVGFHPAFDPPGPDVSGITASILMISGAADPIVSDDDRSRFMAEMRELKVADWRLEVYGGVGHSFTNPSVNARGLDGFAYDERADRRAWSQMLELFAEVLD